MVFASGQFQFHGDVEHYVPLDLQTIWRQVEKERWLESLAYFLAPNGKNQLDWQSNALRNCVKHLTQPYRH